ncbi:hypothetical protein QTP70_002356 [Hemibagrus guttatus]|uniref:C2H2-type domain-containing protein n=1 Tax=Hemibagrus guttatus TaxID=175788 RepID=A0AAE0RD22_9TELE|nr:hypothetical protein QTP70_002356 [Hemibagrus guttatus]
MSSELTIDIQLTELGFSSWDFQVLKQKETQQTSDLEYASSSSSSSSSTPPPSSSCPMSVEILADEEPDVALGHNPSLVHVDSTETRTGKGSRTVCEKEGGSVGERRRKCPWYDENAAEQFKEGKKKKIHGDQRKNDKLKERGAERKLVSVADVSGEEEENEEEEEEDDEDDGSDDDDDGGLTDEEGRDDVLSSDTNGSEEHRCQVCSLTFSTSFLLHEHLHVHNGVRLYHCAECGKQFCHLVNYRKHLRSHAIQCVICAAQFTSQEDLQQHLDTNHFEDKFYQCDLCKRIFTSMAECKKHVQTHKRRTKRYPCPKCERSFRHRSSMLYHLKRHNKGVFLCTDCGLAFSTKAVLLRHSFHHLGLLPYTCIRCKRHFRLSSLYLKHECKPEQLQCVACLVIFQSQEDFQKHKKDTGCWGHQTALSAKTNDIRCMECGQVFNSSEELKKHAGTHQRVMRCSECGMGFRSSIMLMSHMGGHVAQRPCLCKECGLGFCHQQAYDSHLKTCGLVNPAEIAIKKQKPNSVKKNAGTTAQSKEIQTVPQHLHPTDTVSSQTQPAVGLTTTSMNKEPHSPVPLVMLLPVPSTSTSSSILNPQKLTSDVSKKCVSAPQVIHIPLPSDDSSLHKEPVKTVVLKDVARPVSASNILISMKNTKIGWTPLQGPGTIGSVPEMLAVRKENKQVAAVNSKLIVRSLQLPAKIEQKKKVLSNLEILQILNVIKKNSDKKENVSSSTTSASASAEMKADDGKQEGSRLETSNTPLEKSSDAKSATNRERDGFGDQIPKASIHSNQTELSSENSEQNTDKHPEEENLDLDNAAMEFDDKSDIVQCETCGKILLEKDLVQHTMKHSVSSLPTTS